MYGRGWGVEGYWWAMLCAWGVVTGEGGREEWKWGLGVESV